MRQTEFEKSIFIVVEAKRTSNLPDASYEAELIGRLTGQLIRRYVYSISDYWLSALPSHCSAFMCLLTVSRTTSHIGALTDSKTWCFYYIVQGKFYQATLIADTTEQTSLVLGICPNLL